MRTRAVQGKRHPVQRVVAPVADVDGDASKLGLEYRVPGVALHVVSALIEVADARDVVLAVLADHVAAVADNDSRVPDRSGVREVALEDGRYDDDVVPLGELLALDRRRARLCARVARLR